MEKIKEALAKAKLGKTGTNKVLTSSASGLIMQRNAVAAQGDIGDIKYTDSLVIKLDQAHLEKHRIVTHISNDANSAIFDSLRTQILQKMEENNWRTLAIVSPTPESGKSVVSINLAVSIARQPQKTVVLVDFDLRRPKMANYLGIHVEKSMNEYLAGTARIEEVMINPSIPRLVIMPTMRPVSRSADTLSSNKVKGLIKELKERYDSRIIIIDLPPIIGSDDAMVLLPQIDCVLMVIANGVSTEDEIEEAMHVLPKDNLIGVVFNKVETEQKSYYY